MSDVSKTNELIAELRDLSDRIFNHDGKTRDFRLIDRAADALATRVPVQGEPNDDREALARVLYIASDDFAFADRMAKAWDAPGTHGRQRWYRYADAVIAAGFSRATVHDAATDGDYHEGLEEGIKIGRAERDAATAAIERVRAIHHPDTYDVSGKYCTCEEAWPCSTIAALDGAPEPEWEYGYELIEPDDRDVFEREGDFISAAFAYRAAKKRIDEEHDGNLPRLQYLIVRRRKAGPWLPVEGERP